MNGIPHRSAPWLYSLSLFFCVLFFLYMSCVILPYFIFYPMFIKSFKNPVKWLGKHVGGAVKDVVGAVEKGNSWLGKTLSQAEHAYKTFKESAISESPEFLRPATREAFDVIESSPLGVGINEAVRDIRLKSNQLNDVLESEPLRRFVGT